MVWSANTERLCVRETTSVRSMLICVRCRVESSVRHGALARTDALQQRSSDCVFGIFVFDLSAMDHWLSRAGDSTVNKRHMSSRIGGSAFMDFAGAR